jgi:hypothetical protein
MWHLIASGNQTLIYTQTKTIMKNLEQKLAQSLLNQYEFCERMWQEKAIDRDYFTGQRVAIMSIATAMFGKEIMGQIPLEFKSNLEKIANSEPQANLVEVSRFEAFGLYKHYSAKSVSAMQEGFSGSAEWNSKKAEKWLDVAVKIEQSDADGVGKNLMHI